MHYGTHSHRMRKEKKCSRGSRQHQAQLAIRSRTIRKSKHLYLNHSGNEGDIWIAGFLVRYIALVARRKTLSATGWRRLIGCFIFIGDFPQSDLYLVALLWKMICNLGDPMSLRHPVWHAHACTHTQARTLKGIAKLECPNHLPIICQSFANISFFPRQKEIKFPRPSK